MHDLVESIVHDDYVSASGLFQEHMEQIMEKKLYEVKRMMQVEVVKPTGTKDADGNPQFSGGNSKEDWALYRKQTKRKPEKLVSRASAPFGSGQRLNKADIEARRKAGYVQAHPALRALKFIKAVADYKETGKINEHTNQPSLPNTGLGGQVANQLNRIRNANPNQGQQPKPQAGSLGTSGGKGKKGKQTGSGGVTPGMGRYIRRMGGATELKYIKQGIKGALAPGKSFGGRIRSLKRAGKVFSTTKAGKAVGAIGRAGGNIMSDISDKLQTQE